MLPDGVLMKEKDDGTTGTVLNTTCFCESRNKDIPIPPFKNKVLLFALFETVDVLVSGKTTVVNPCSVSPFTFLKKVPPFPSVKTAKFSTGTVLSGFLIPSCLITMLSISKVFLFTFILDLSLEKDAGEKP